MLSQNETNHWYFGNNAGLNFSNGDFAVLDDGSMQTPAGCSSISDRDGNLMFYTNGHTVWNRNHQIMQNGEGLSGDIEGVQTSIIIPKPNDLSTYYIFYTRQNTVTSPVYYLAGIYYSEVKFDALHPLGYITDNKDIRVGEVIEATPRIAAIHHPESNSIRVISITKPDPVPGYVVPDDEFVFRIFNVTPDGVNETYIIRDLNESIGRIGQMKISPDGKYLAFADNINLKIYFYNYDNDTISFNPYVVLQTVPAFGLFINPYGIEFSQDSKMFYYAGGNHVVQFPFLDIGGIEIPTYYYVTALNPGSIQLARNGKIYISQGTSNNPISFISVINKPEKPGAECDFQQAVAGFPGGSSTRGLPTFVASYLRNRIIASDDDCVDTVFHFDLDAYTNIESVVWDFGDGGTSTSMTPSHQFSEPGIHKVSATIMINDYPVTLYKDVEAYPLPSLDPGQTLEQCDTDNDGISLFNLESIGDKMNNPNPDYEYVFYHSLNDLMMDVDPIENHQVYENQTNPEQIFVRITSPEGCTSTSDFYIQSTYIVLEAIGNMYVCESSDGVLNDGAGEFNLLIKEADIRNQFNVPATYTVTFYQSVQDAQTNLNAIGDRYYITTTTTIWVKIYDEGHNCNGIGSIQLIVNPEIELDIEEIYTICDPATHPTIVLDGGNNDSWEWKNASGTTLSTSRFFPLTQTGTFSVVVNKAENGINCSVSKSFIVRDVQAPVFITVTAQSSEIYVLVSGYSQYEFSLDGLYYYGNGASYTFTNIRSGIYTVYVRDVNRCEPTVTTEVFLFSFPKFFTPNGDGRNDYWGIRDDVSNLFQNIEIYIFDRYGKQLHYMNMNEGVLLWDGIYNGKPLRSDDYWYKANIVDNDNKTQTRRGHFTLKR